MPAAPLPANEAQRFLALTGCKILDTDPEAEFDDLTRLAAMLCEVPIALVSLLDKNRQWFKSRVGLPVPETPRSQAFCGYAILGGEPLVIEDASKDPRTLDNPLVTGEPGIRFYAGIPLRLSTGEALGTLCVIDTRPRALNTSQLQDLGALARQATSQLELRYRIHQLESLSKAPLAAMTNEIAPPTASILKTATELANNPAALCDTSRVSKALGKIQKQGENLRRIINATLETLESENE